MVGSLDVLRVRTPKPPLILFRQHTDSGNILLRGGASSEEKEEECSLGGVALADLGLASAWTPLRAALDMRAVGMLCEVLYLVGRMMGMGVG